MSNEKKKKKKNIAEIEMRLVKGYLMSQEENDQSLIVERMMLRLLIILEN